MLTGQGENTAKTGIYWGKTAVNWESFPKLRLVPVIKPSRLGKVMSMSLFVVLGVEAESVLVDSSTPRRQAVEPEQLPHGHDPGPRWGGGHP